MIRTRSVFSFDFLLLSATLALTVVGILFIYSSGVSATGIVFSSEYIKQIVWVSVGFILLLVVSFSDYTRFKDWSLYIYVLFVLLLIITLFFGKRVNGAKSWLGFLNLGIGIQAGEFAKIGTILLLGSYIDANRGSIRSLTTFAVCLGITMLPVGLVMIEPDLGTALVYFPIFLVMTFVAGTKKRYVLFVLLTGTLLSMLSLLTFWQLNVTQAQASPLQILTDRDFFKYLLYSIGAVLLVSLIGLVFMKRRYFYWLSYGFSSLFLGVIGTLAATSILKPFQVMRLIVFLNPNIDPRGAGWNIIQSITAVGSGGFFGKGFLHGTQSHYRFLPQQSTDFIFSIFSEEWGFVGVVLLFSLFLIIFVRGLRIIAASNDPFAVYIGSGIVAMFFFHMIVNVGMAIGIMPITGIPLLLVSYGGSSLWTALLGIGLLMNIHYRRYM